MITERCLGGYCQCITYNQYEGRQVCKYCKLEARSEVWILGIPSQVYIPEQTSEKNATIKHSLKIRSEIQFSLLFIHVYLQNPAVTSPTSFVSIVDVSKTGSCVLLLYCSHCGSCVRLVYCSHCPVDSDVSSVYSMLVDSCS